MTFKTLIAAASVALATTAAASAQDANWTGFYGGLSFGMGTLDASSGGSDDFHSLGVHAGYLHDFGAYVLGAEIEHAKVDFGGGGLAAGITSDVTRLKARAGYDAGQFLPYAFVGASRLSLATVGSDTLTNYGVGVDYQMTEQVRIGAEYLVEESNGGFAGSGTEITNDVLSVRMSVNF